MHYSYLLSAAIAALVIALPTPEEIKLLDGTTLTVSPAGKRSPSDIQLLDGTYLTVGPSTSSKIKPRDSTRLTDLSAHGPNPLAERGADKISSCGPKSGWMTVSDNGTYLDTPMWGYTSAVAAFCSRSAYGLNTDGSATPVVVAAGKSISYTVKWQIDTPGVQDDLRGSRVGLKGAQPGHIEFEVNNKRDPGTKAGQGDYTMNEKDCNSYLSNMAASTSDCYGSDNKDTKGGTWQMEDNKLTFHALPYPDSGDKPNAHDEFR